MNSGIVRIFLAYVKGNSRPHSVKMLQYGWENNTQMQRPDDQSSSQGYALYNLIKSRIYNDMQMSWRPINKPIKKVYKLFGLTISS